MISQATITGWREHAPWGPDAQVEQDLVISRALVELFSDDLISSRVAFRGGTALHKLFLLQERYSEDIDLVLCSPGAFGEIMGRIRSKLTPWLGKPQYKQTEDRVTFYFKYTSEIPPVIPMKLKIEINMREHFSVFDYKIKQFSIASIWFTGQASVRTFSLEELLATKLRALYQRKKGRDLFDQWACHSKMAVDCQKVIEAFKIYIDKMGLSVSRAQFERNLALKLKDPMFSRDVQPLIIQPDLYDAEIAANLVKDRLLSLL